MEIPAAFSNFIQEWAEAGGPVARQNSLPVGAMLACASVESNWGQGTIYKNTLNPFSLQKWPATRYPATNRTFWAETVIHENPKVVKKAPFNCATDRADAVRQWCEWILHYGEADGPPGAQDPKQARAVASAKANRDKLLASRGNSLDFAMNLPLVGFGEHATAKQRETSGKGYLKRLTDFSMFSFD